MGEREVFAVFRTAANRPTSASVRLELSAPAMWSAAKTKSAVPSGQQRLVNGLVDRSPDALVANITNSVVPSLLQ
ncbi:hypothetical protein [Streptomyces sp. NPDC050704]|uniref:hypothetical protein n=1 Tax=Streptomyces sp. NPDC050704 TaxID=3157219 RepID=UPI00343A5DB7